MSLLSLADRLVGKDRHEVVWENIGQEVPRPSIRTLTPIEQSERLYEERIAQINGVSVIPSKFPYTPGLGLMVIQTPDGQLPPKNIQHVSEAWGVDLLKRLNSAVGERLSDESESELDQIIYGVNAGGFRSIPDVLHVHVAGIENKEWFSLREDQLDGFKNGMEGFMMRNRTGKEIVSCVSEKISYHTLVNQSVEIRDCGSVFLELKGSLKSEQGYCEEQFGLWRMADQLVREEFGRHGVDPRYRCHAITFGQELGNPNAVMTINAAVAFGSVNGGMMEGNKMIVSERKQLLSADKNQQYFAQTRKFASMME